MTSTRTLLLVALALFGQDQAPRDATPKSGVATVRGRVVAAGTGDPIRHARVVMTSSTPGPRDPVLTDGEGRFVFTGLPPGSYSVIASKPGFARTAYGSRALGVGPATYIDLADGQTVDGIEVRMTRSGAISGHIIDEFGDPVESATVSAQRFVRTETGISSTVTVASTTTDDLGEYYLGGLPGGTFLVSASLTPFETVTMFSNGNTLTMTRSDATRFRRSYYPGVPTFGQAQPIPVRAGEERSAIDFALAPGAMATLSIRCVDARGNPVNANTMVVSADGSASDSAVMAHPLTCPSTSTSLEPGQWAVYARDADRVGMARVSLSAGDDTSVTVTLIKGARISGRVIADGLPLTPRADVPVQALPLDPGFAVAAAPGSFMSMRPDGTFDLDGLIGRRELRVRSVPRGWVLSAILYEGRNLLDSPIDLEGGEELTGVQVVLSSRVSQLTGTVTNAARTPLRDYSVLVFPEDPALLRNPRRLTRVVRPNQYGQFTAEDLLPGSYLAIALDEVDVDEWLNAAYLNQLRERATRVTLGEGEKKTIGIQSLQTSPAAIGSATLRGHVLRSDGRPLPRVQVLLAPADDQRFVRSTHADDSGAFEFARVPSGRYRLTASRPGYVTLEYGQRRPLQRGEIVSLGDNETRERVDITLPRHGAITGRIVDENGDPVERASVRVMQTRYLGGRRQLVGVPGAKARPTDERGRYRIYGLQPGNYVVAAEVGQVGTDDLPGYATSYYPGTPNPSEAQTVAVGISQDVASVDFSLVPVRTVRISGRTIGADGEPFQGGIQMRPSRRSGAVSADAVGARTEPDGTFEFPNVSPGEYVVHAFRGNNEYAWQFVAVNGADVTGLILQTASGSTIAGRITFEGGVPNRSGLEIVLVPVEPDLAPFNGGPGQADIHDDWTFEINNVSGPRRLRPTRLPAGWTLQAVRVNGIDASDAVLNVGAKDLPLTDVEIVLTNRLTEISGRVTDARGQPTADCTVIAFAVDRQLWYDSSRFFMASRPSRDGTFVLRALPPGDYFLAAVDRIPGTETATEWQDPELLESISRSATRVTLTEGQKLAVSTKVIVR